MFPFDRADIEWIVDEAARGEAVWWPVDGEGWNQANIITFQADLRAEAHRRGWRLNVGRSEVEGRLKVWAIRRRVGIV